MPGTTVIRWGTLPDGRSVRLFRLRNAAGMEADVSEYGAALVRLTAPDREGRFDDIVLGFDSLAGYLRGNPSSFGVMVGRCAGRIAGARFVLDGREILLPANDGRNHLHGGPTGFGRKLWSGTAVDAAGGASVHLHLESPDGDDGYPGRLAVDLAYSLGDSGELELRWSAVADAPTPVNLTNHSYFNLAGRGDVLAHRVAVASDAFLPAGEGLIPTGEVRPVGGSAFDLRHPTVVGDILSRDDAQLRAAGGIDHTWVLATGASSPVIAAEVSDPLGGRTLQVLTTEPGLLLYTGNFLDGTERGKNGTPCLRHAGLCLEAQHFPDSPNRRSFPSVILRPGVRRSSVTVYRFGVS